GKHRGAGGRGGAPRRGAGETGRLQISAEPNPMAGDPTRHGRSARRRHGSQARREISSRRAKERAAGQPLIRCGEPFEGRSDLQNLTAGERRVSDPDPPGTRLSRATKAVIAVSFGRENNPGLYVCKASSRSSRRRDKGSAVPSPKHLPPRVPA